MVEERPKIQIVGYYPASGDLRPIVVNASGELPISATTTVEISGQPVRVSGERARIEGYYSASGDWRPVAVNASGELVIEGAGAANISGQPVWISSGEIHVVSGEITTSVSGDIIRAEQHGAWGVRISGEVLTKRATTMSTAVYTVTAASGGTQIATTNSNRISLLVQNIGTGDIYLKESPLQSGEGIKITSDGSYTTNTYIGDLWAYAVTSGDKVVVNEEA